MTGASALSTPWRVKVETPCGAQIEGPKASRNTAGIQETASDTDTISILPAGKCLLQDIHAQPRQEPQKGAGCQPRWPGDPYPLSECSKGTGTGASRQRMSPADLG